MGFIFLEFSDSTVKRHVSFLPLSSILRITTLTIEYSDYSFHSLKSSKKNLLQLKIIKTLLWKRFSFDCLTFCQNSLTVQIKQVDATSHHIMQKYTERQKAFAKYAEHTRKIEQVSTSLKRVRMNLEQTLSLLDELNSMLPENEKLEPF